MKSNSFWVVLMIFLVLITSMASYYVVSSMIEDRANEPIIEPNNIIIDQLKKENEELRIMLHEDSITIKFYTERVEDAETKVLKFNKRHHEKINSIDTLNADQLYDFLSNERKR